ncbi:methyltransferase [Paenibacillus sp. J31TS4]|uniref:TRM11 family SAM-dependent methyltransferase n=1 Tax=Paenibacillus sp. J31TS4 TaxID=2807195 RepID=UPI001B1C4C1C|nr:RsmD family RNA methyltransferase [Paenibacillus sp. J31TS4]GIP40124.1 methyltransferase [Paenibacillus sp. J31TS4]
MMTERREGLRDDPPAVSGFAEAAQAAVTAGTPAGWLYSYACHEEERELCRLELRTLLACEPGDRYCESGVRLDPSRSPFLKERIDPLCEAETAEELARLVEAMRLDGGLFKVRFVPTGYPVDYAGRREAERLIGGRIRGQAEMRRPDRLFAVTRTEERWVFGTCTEAEPVWLRHKDKPQQYSTALGTRVARAVANLAVPRPEGVRAVDPCCGIGTVLIEALSMGIAIVGYDRNPLAVAGARRNLAHFGMPDVVRLADMRTLTGRYDAAVLDLPYNLCSRLPDEERLELLTSARRLAVRAVIVTTEPIDEAIRAAGFRIEDCCSVRKGTFERQILVCS